MTLPDTETLAASITARLLSVPNVVAVYPRRNSVVAGLVALAAKSIPTAQVAVRDVQGTVVVEATIGITDRDPARDTGQRAYDVITTTLDDFAVVERRVLVRIATVD